MDRRMVIGCVLLLVVAACHDERRAPARAPEESPVAVEPHVRIWFYRGPELVPTLRRPPVEDRLQYLVDELIGGPTTPERAAGLEGSFDPAWEATARVSRVGGTVRVDFAPGPPRERFLASSAFLVEPIERTLMSQPGVESVVVLYDGNTLCDISDEC